jgi:uncharacterized repeat protein (TIGR01451 family)
MAQTSGVSYSDIIRCNALTSVVLWVGNNGVLPLNGVAEITLDDEMQIVWHNGNSLTQSNGNNVILFNLANILSGSSFASRVIIDQPSLDLIGQSFDFSFHLVLYAEDGSVFYENAWNQTRIVTCAYDPNIKTGPVGYADQKFELAGSDMEFTVDFQNTGNAPAEDVIIHDQLDLSVFDLESFQPVFASHTFSTVVHDNGLVKFQFHDIMLPDSASDELGSRGFVTYRIRTHENLAHAVLVENRAEIYFDQNPAIVTNTTSNAIFDCSTLQVNLNAQNDCFGISYEFEPDLDYVESYEWSLNGSVISVADSALIDLPEPGNYTLELLATNPLCSITSQTEFTVYPLPDASIYYENEVIYATSGVSFQWFNFSELLADEVSDVLPIWNYAADGFQVYAMITDENGCVSQSNVLTANSIIDVTSESIILFPNPMVVDAYLVIPDGHWQVQVFDLTGKLICDYRDVAHEVKFTRQQLDRGVYHISLSNESGERFTRKLIVK